MPSMIPGDPSEWFASLAQFLICSVVTLTLFSIYFRGLTVKSSNTRDKGFWYLAWASLIWAAVGLLQLLKVYGVLAAAAPGEAPRLFDILRTVGSIVNTAILLGAAVHLDAYDLSGKKPPPRFLHPILRLLRDNVGFGVVVLIAALSILVNFLQPATAKASSVNPDAITLAVYKLPDAATSIAIIFFLMYGFFASFQNRMFPLLAWAAFLALGIQVVAQVFDMFQSKNLYFQAWHWQLILSSKIMVCALFIALPFSWLHEAWEDLAKELAAASQGATDTAQRADTIAVTAAELAPTIELEPPPVRTLEAVAATEPEPMSVPASVSNATNEPKGAPVDQPLEAIALARNPESNPSAEALTAPAPVPVITLRPPTLQIPGPHKKVEKKGLFYTFRISCALEVHLPIETQKRKMFLRLLEMISKSYNPTGENAWIRTKNLFDGDELARGDFYDLWNLTKLDPLFDVDENKGIRRLRLEHNFVDVDFKALDDHFKSLKKEEWEHADMWDAIRKDLASLFENRASNSILGTG